MKLGNKKPVYDHNGVMLIDSYGYYTGEGLEHARRAYAEYLENKPLIDAVRAAKKAAKRKKCRK